jgi:arginase
MLNLRFNHEHMAHDITFIINNSEITAGTRGASLGPSALMQVARSQNETLFGTIPQKKVIDLNHLLDLPTPFPFAKRIDGLKQIYESCSSLLVETIQEGKFPLVLAGDHGSAGGTIAGIRQAYPGKRLGVIWIDAHGDLHSPYTTPSGNMHGMPLSTALALDNKECLRNQVDVETATMWDDLKKLHGISPKISAEDLVFIAVRDTEEEEDYILENLRIRNFKVEEVRAKGCAQVISEATEQLKNCDLIYVSFDVDSMDPQLTSHGTGTPVPNGLTPAEATELLLILAKNPKTCCMEIVEINPCLDEKTNKMAEVSYEILKSLIKQLTN